MKPAPFAAATLAALGGAALLAAASSSDTPALQWKEYEADVPKTIIELQPFRRAASVEFQMSGDWGTATLVNLNPQINAWFLLTLWWPGTPAAIAYHLENPLPKTQTLALGDAHPYGITLSAGGLDAECELWTAGRPAALQQAQRSDLPYAPLCEDRLYLRNRVSGTYTHLERVTNFLRDRCLGWGADVGFVKKEFFRDAFLEKGGAETAARPPATPDASSNGPRPAPISEAFAALSVMPEHLGIDVGQGPGGVLLGRWYPVRDTSGIFVSVMQPQAIAVSGSHAGYIDSVEAAALDYMVALDLGEFDLGFALGTDHPRVGWSERALESVRSPALPGPDGIGSVAPLVVNGMVSPPTVPRVAASFAGGFKREHGAFRYGPLAQQNHGTHYGFIEQGVVFSKLQPGLATLIVDEQGTVRMKTWTSADDSLLPHIKFARQNGVPLIEHEQQDRRVLPGRPGRQLGTGQLRRAPATNGFARCAPASVCRTRVPRDLIYGWFSTATPRAMARVFQAYGCRYAMHLDMNALEHTYFALYTRKNGQILVQHLVEGMAEVDRKGGGGELAPRFLSFPDDRDFFYVTRQRDDR